MSTVFNIDEWHNLTEQGANIAATIHPTGVSMRPLIRGGIDTVTAMPLRRALKKGDIVLFRRADGKDVMHRVWKIIPAPAQLDEGLAAQEKSAAKSVGAQENSATTIITFGDGCWYHDEPITEDKILGLAVTLHRVKHASKTASPATPNASAQPGTSATPNASAQPGSPATPNASTQPASQKVRKIKLDTPYRRAIGRAWLFFSPLRRCFYRLRNITRWVKRQIKKRL